MRLVVVLFAALIFAVPANAGELHVAVLSPVEDVSLPFFCDWGYDWDERCFWDDSDRLGVGGVGDKVWRSALRFPIDVLPRSAVVVTAELSLRYDRTCVAPSRRIRPCEGRGFELDAHPIFTPRWLAEREVEYGPVAAVAELEPLAPTGWVVWDVTDLVSAWQAGDLRNDGLLLELSDGEEALESGGPAFPSSSYSGPSVRPRLSVWYEPG